MSALAISRQPKGISRWRADITDDFYFLRRDCKRRGVRFEKPNAKEKRLWSDGYNSANFWG
jgi:hypothetical protein